MKKISQYSIRKSCIEFNSYSKEPLHLNNLNNELDVSRHPKRVPRGYVIIVAYLCTCQSKQAVSYISSVAEICSIL